MGAELRPNAADAHGQKGRGGHKATPSQAEGPLRPFKGNRDFCGSEQSVLSKASTG